MQAELLDAPKTEIAKQQPIDWDLLREQALATFDIQSEAIAKEVAADTKLTVTDDNTREAARKRKQVWVKRRTGLEKTRKAASEDAKKIVELVKEVASSFQSEFDKAEQHLAGQIDAYDAEIERKKQQAIDAVFNAKNDRLVAAGLTLPRILVDSMSDIEIDDKISEAVELARFRKAEADRLAAEKAEADRVAAEQAEANRIEAERLAAERREFETQQAAAKAEQDRLAKIEADKLAAERAELDRLKAEQEESARLIREQQEEAQRNIEAEQKRLADIELTRIEAEQQAERERLAEIERQRLETERIERERLEAEENQQREEAARVRAEQLRPDREKLAAFADELAAMADKVPEVSPASAFARQLVVNAAKQAASTVHEIAETLVK